MKIFAKYPSRFLGIYEEEAGYLVPEECVNEHLNVAEENSASLRFNETVVSWSLLRPTLVVVDDGNLENDVTKSQENLYEITTTHGINGEFTTKYLTRKIVLAVGPWAPELYGNGIPLQLHAERRVQFWFKPKDIELFKVTIVLCDKLLWRTRAIYENIVLFRKQPV